MSDDIASQVTTEDAQVVDATLLNGDVQEEAESTGPKPIYEDTEKTEEDPKPDVKEKTEEKDNEESEDKEEGDEKEDFDSLEKPEDSLLSDADMERIVSEAKEQGLSKEAAQKQVELASDLLKRNAETVTEKHSELSDKWVQQCRDDKEIGGQKFDESVKFANDALKRFATKEFIQSLHETKFGNNPEVVRIFARIGRAMSPDKTVLPGPHPGADKSLEDIFYGSKQTN